MTEMAGIEITDQHGPGVVYQGHIGIEWPAKRDTSLVLPGWGCTIWDALSGKQITTVTRIELHATANDVIAADVTMFADENGPVFTLPGGPDVVVYERTFPFLVAEMRVAQPARERGALEPRFQEPCPS